MSIFVSVVSYRDPHLKLTLESAIENAKYPEELHFGIVNQDIERDAIDYSFLPKYSLITINPKEAKGVGFARSKAMSLYSDQTYYLQVDSHTQFSKDWDINSIKQLKLAEQQANNKKVILSCYPGPYSLENNRIFIHTKSTEEHPVEPTKQIPFLRTDDRWSAKRIPLEKPECGLPELSTTVLGGYLFSNGNIVDEIPYDPEISFMGEEICFAMRAWTRRTIPNSPRSKSTRPTATCARCRNWCRAWSRMSRSGSSAEPSSSGWATPSACRRRGAKSPTMT